MDTYWGLPESLQWAMFKDRVRKRIGRILKRRNGHGDHVGDESTGSFVVERSFLSAPAPGRHEFELNSAALGIREDSAADLRRQRRSPLNAGPRTLDRTESASITAGLPSNADEIKARLPDIPPEHAERYQRRERLLGASDLGMA